MNNRIQELFKRAGGKTSIHNLMSNPMQQREYRELWDGNIDKFAELIVRECANVLDPNGEYAEKYKHSHTPDPDGLRTVLSQEQYFEMLASKKLKKHFGVEE